MKIIKKIIIALSVIGFGIICFIAGGKVKEVQYEDTISSWNKKLNISDSLDKLMILRQNK